MQLSILSACRKRSLKWKEIKNYSCPGLASGEGEIWPIIHCVILSKRLLKNPNVYAVISLAFLSILFNWLATRQTRSLGVPLTTFPVGLLRSQNIKTYFLKFCIGNCYTESRYYANNVLADPDPDMVAMSLYLSICRNAEMPKCRLVPIDQILDQKRSTLSTHLFSSSTHSHLPRTGAWRTTSLPPCCSQRPFVLVHPNFSSTISLIIINPFRSNGQCKDQVQRYYTAGGRRYYH